MPAPWVQEPEAYACFVDPGSRSLLGMPALWVQVQESPLSVPALWVQVPVAR